MTLERLSQSATRRAAVGLDALDELHGRWPRTPRSVVGPEPGTTFTEREEVRRRFEFLLAYHADAEGPAVTRASTANIGTAQWSFSYDDGDSASVEMRGCDIYAHEAARSREGASQAVDLRGIEYR